MMNTNLRDARNLLLSVMEDQPCECELSDWEATDDCWHNKIAMANDLLLEMRNSEFHHTVTKTLLYGNNHLPTGAER
jgi:hypothetical protein